MIANRSWRGGRHGVWCGALPALLLLAACAPAVPGGVPQSGVTESADGPALGQALAVGGGRLLSFSGNGITQNGLAGNGISQNGLAALGLDEAGVSTASFEAWFNTDPGLSSMVMRYLYKCAAPAGTSLSWTNPATGADYTWPGVLGLAPGWIGGAAATVDEQQVITACLGALTNKFGMSVTIAVEGRNAQGTALAIEPDELTSFSVQEACFFGNLFSDEGVFVGADHAAPEASTSSIRACGLRTEAVGLSSECPPLSNVGYCSENCTLDEGGIFYESCTWGGVTYRPLTTRIRPLSVYACGDGVCQLTERCGSGEIPESCLADCGPCP